MSLFETSLGKRQKSESSPLAERMRPETLDDFVGQVHLIGPGKPLQRQIEKSELTSLILWGPPGSGKTTLAGIIAHQVSCNFVHFSAVLSGIREIKQVMADAERVRGRNSSF